MKSPESGLLEKRDLRQQQRINAAEVRLRAEIRVGELLGAMKKTGERDTGKGGDRRSQRKKVSQSDTPTVKDLGISRDQSAQWQQAAAVPQGEREAYIADTSQIPMVTGKFDLAWHSP